MTIAIWIIAIVELIRAAQNMVQILALRHEMANKDNAYAEYIKSLHMTDREFVRRMLEEFERQDG